MDQSEPLYRSTRKALQIDVELPTHYTTNDGRSLRHTACEEGDSPKCPACEAERMELEEEWLR